MTAKALMFQGTGSDVGKSLIVAGLCRLLANRGWSVKPFKPQNMSNNAAVTVDGGEIGRAQALQARAARVEPSVHMNPVLLKPQSQTGAQIVVHGKVEATALAKEFQSLKAGLMPRILESFATIKSDADFVLVEGAGSASEINLRANDIANMGFSRAANVPVVLIGDIDRGGIIASLVGTKAVIDAKDSAMIEGFIVNRMRGDVSLFDDGNAAIADKTGWKSMGVVPHFDDARILPAEDALALRETARWTKKEAGRVRMAVLALPHIANFDDLDPLRLDPNIDLVLVKPGEAISGDVDLVILPGSKATIADLAELRRQGWDVDLQAHIRRGGHVLGVCGGYQMLGEVIGDPHGIEGQIKSVAGLGYLRLETVLTSEKTLEAVRGVTVADGVEFTGYEMHMGRTAGGDTARPLVRFEDGRVDGAVSKCGRIYGTYAHGFFADNEQRQAWIKRLSGLDCETPNYDALIETTLDDLAQHLEHHLDIEALLNLAR
ncbi:MAG: cobyric acid synthase [Hyphomicrobiaceae bacterium]